MQPQAKINDLGSHTLQINNKHARTARACGNLKPNSTKKKKTKKISWHKYLEHFELYYCRR